MPNVTIANPMANRGVAVTDGDKLALGLKVFAGEVLTAFQRSSVTNGHVLERSITSGKSAQFPVFGRTKAHYLKAGQSLDDKRENIQQSERVIHLDGLLTADTLIFDLDEFIAHYDFRSPYAAELGNALALSYDASILAECAKEALNTQENVAGNGLGGVIEQTIGEKLPKDFQRAEYLEAHGFIDAIVPRNEMRDTLIKILKLHQKEGRHA